MLENAIATKSVDEGAPVGLVPAEAPLVTGEMSSRIFNLGLALVFLPYALIIMGLVWVVMKAANSDNGPFLYRGERLGRGKKPYQIYKIRTLALGAEQRIGGELYRPGGNLELRGGAFLRKSRLDELPQLFNIIRGDMNFIGPRPLRRAVYEKNRAFIPNYDARFAIRPGLTGFSQFFTPHKTPKRIRSRIDNHYYLRRQSGPLFEALFILRTAYAVLRNSLTEAAHLAGDGVARLVRGLPLKERRRMRRMRLKNANLALLDERGQPVGAVVRLLDINHETLAVQTDRPLPENQPLRVRLSAPKRGGRLKTARLIGFVRPATTEESSDQARSARRYVIDYEPVTGLHRYMVDQYVLKDSIA